MMVTKEEYAELLQMILELQDKVNENNTILKSIVDRFMVMDETAEMAAQEIIEECQEQEFAAQEVDMENYGFYVRETEKAVMFKNGIGLIAWFPKKALKGWNTSAKPQKLEVADWCEWEWKKDTYGG